METAVLRKPSRRTKEVVVNVAEQGYPFEIPEGYVTGDEFVRRVKEKLITSFKADGLL
jgi:hypothetical protein